MGPPSITPWPLRLICLLLPLAGAACQHQPGVSRPIIASNGLSVPEPVDAVESVCAPPMDWTPCPLESTARHAHQHWVSPTGDTAYGVIQMHLPIPVGSGLVLWAFLNEMRQHQGEARLLARQDDPALPGLRFTAEGGIYKLRTNLIVRGFSAWAVYAGTRRDRPENPAELPLAERAREATEVGR